MNVRKHNDYDSLLSSALQKEHPDWSQETIREAALICSNTILPLFTIQQQALLDEIISKARPMQKGKYATKQAAVLVEILEAIRKELK